MRALVPVSLFLLCLPLGVSCSKDFDAFSFGDSAPESPDDGGTSSTDGSFDTASFDTAVADAEGDARGEASDATMDSGQAPTDANAQHEDAFSDAESTPDRYVPLDSGEGADASQQAAADGSRDAPSDVAADAEPDAAGTASDASQRDAETFGEAACRAAVEPMVPVGKDSCDSCGCEDCYLEIASCLNSGDESENTLCGAVVECALENSCRVWDCYCANASCTMGGTDPPDGDGPCVAEMNAAADGHKAEVEAVWGTGDTSHPLVRALDAVSCLLGRDRKSPNGELMGMCETECL